MENAIDPAVYSSTLKTTRKRRKLFFATVLVYIPALLITNKISPANEAMATVFAVWLVLLIIATFLVATSRCPRCGNYFHVHGMALLILRKCLHCQLHIRSNTSDD